MSLSNFECEFIDRLQDNNMYVVQAQREAAAAEGEKAKRTAQQLLTLARQTSIVTESYEVSNTCLQTAFTIVGSIAVSSLLAAPTFSHTALMLSFCAQALLVSAVCFDLMAMDRQLCMQIRHATIEQTQHAMQRGLIAG